MSPKLLNLLLVILPVVLYFGYIQPYYTGDGGLVWSPETSIRALQSQNVQYINTLAQIGIIKEAGEKLNNDYLSVDKDMIEKIGIMLPDDIDPVKLRNEILQIGASSGIAIENLKIERDIKTEKLYNFYRVSFEIKAKYANFKSFMEEYEKNKRFFSLEKASINRTIHDETDKMVKNDDDILNISITSRAYFLK